MKYHKLPVVINAWPVRTIMEWKMAMAEERAIKFSKHDIPALNAIHENVFTVQRSVTHPLAIETLEGTMNAPADAMVIMGVKGEFYFCDKEVFEETYKEGEPQKLKCSYADEYKGLLPPTCGCSYCEAVRKGVMMERSRNEKAVDLIKNNPPAGCVGKDFDFGSLPCSCTNKNCARMGECLHRLHQIEEDLV